MWCANLGRRSMQALEPGQRGIHRNGTAFREPHDRDPRRIDPRVRGQELQGPVGIADHRLAELRLVLRGEGDGPAREAIEDERRHTRLWKPSAQRSSRGPTPPEPWTSRRPGPARLALGKFEVPPDNAGGRGPHALEELRIVGVVV